MSLEIFCYPLLPSVFVKQPNIDASLSGSPRFSLSSFFFQTSLSLPLSCGLFLK